MEEFIIAAKKETSLKVNENTDISPSGFAPLAAINLAEIMAEELEGLDAGFERIKMPSAGSTFFEIPGDDPSEPEAVKSFTGVILYHHVLFTYYKEKYTGSINPPDCGTVDGVRGIGTPGGICKACPLNKFGSGENDAKACKNRRRIFIMREGEIFPVLISLPSGSLKEFTKYLKRLIAKGRKSNSVVTRFSLKKTTSTGGIEYSQAQFEIDRILTQEESVIIEGMSEQVREYSKLIAIDYERADEMESEDGYTVDEETGEVIPPLN